MSQGYMLTPSVKITYGVEVMSVVSHIVHLQSKHYEFENALAAEMARPSPNFYTVKDLKKQKLLLKEEIARLMHEVDRLRQDAS